MTNVWFTSDNHFGHGNIIRHANRPFGDSRLLSMKKGDDGYNELMLNAIKDMDETMISRWNDVVKPADHVYHLGDVSFHNTSRTVNILNRLNGNIFLIEGNHDRKRLTGDVPKRFEWIKIYHDFSIGGKHIVMCHYPFETWDKACHGSWHLHGHSHGSLKTWRGGRLDVGVDTHDFRPWSFDEIKDYMSSKSYDPIDQHGA